MPTHNPECTHGGAHAPSECRDRFARHLKPLEDPISVENPPLGSNIASKHSEPSNVVGGLTDADREALRVALAGLVPISANLGAEAPGLHPITAREWNSAYHDSAEPKSDVPAAT